MWSRRFCFKQAFFWENSQTGLHTTSPVGLVSLSVIRTLHSPLCPGISVQQHSTMCLSQSRELSLSQAPPSIHQSPKHVGLTSYPSETMSPLWTRLPSPLLGSMEGQELQKVPRSFCTLSNTRTLPQQLHCPWNQVQSPCHRAGMGGTTASPQPLLQPYLILPSSSSFLNLQWLF